jgi:Tol biopolymer transport system component/serine/threonine protein kinase
MTPERWRRIKQILADALELETRLQRSHVAAACGGDAELRAEVESLLDAHYEAGDLMEAPALERDASVVEKGAAQLLREGRIGPYRLTGMVGEGGMGSVYRAWREDDPDPKPVAIKVVKPGLDSDEILRRFRRERNILASLEHPNIARLLDSGTMPDGRPYFVMEFIEGLRIDRYCRDLPLDVEQRLALFQQVCLAVDHAHNHRVLHRDIKPGNILVTEAGVPKLLDFGVGKSLDPQSASRVDLTETMMRMITPEYASPEQVMGEPVTAASDIYSLGVVLYELVTGERPYKSTGASPLALAAEICEQDPDPPSTRDSPKTAARAPHPGRRSRGLTPELDDVVLKAMRKRPGQRYASAGHLAGDIERYLRGERTEARRGRTAYRSAAWLSRHRKPVLAAGASALLAASMLLTAAIWIRFRAPEGTPLPPPTRVVPFTTFTGSERQPAFSPGGSEIAFVWDGDEGTNADIYVARARSAPRRLTTDDAEDLSPAWSRDGSRIAFLRVAAGASGVYAVPSAGGAEQFLFPISRPPRGASRIFDWAPDGRTLAVSDAGLPSEPPRIYLESTLARRRVALSTPPPGGEGDTSPAFSPDGGRIAFLRSPAEGVSDVYVAGVGGGAAHRLTFDGRRVSSLAWTPDGRAIVFASDRAGSMALWTVAAGGGEPTRVPGTGDNATEPVFSRDGRRLAFARFFHDVNIWRVPLKPDHRPAGPPVQLIASTVWDSSPQPSPDGTRIAFRSDRSGANEIWTCAAGGEDCAQITRSGGPLTDNPAWSPDGRWLACDSRSEGRAQVYVVASDGGYPRRVAPSQAEDMGPRWSSDGLSIYFSSNRSGAWQIWKAAADGAGRPVQVTRMGGFGAIEGPGGYLYYAKGRDVPGLWRVPAGGGEETSVFPALNAVLWGFFTATKDGVYALDRASARQPWSIVFASGGTLVPLARLASPSGLPERGLAVSSDGRMLYFTQTDNSGGDIMVAEFAP